MMSALIWSLFNHAFSGCDTTSRIFGVGKKSVLKKKSLMVTLSCMLV